MATALHYAGAALRHRRTTGILLVAGIWALAVRSPAPLLWAAAGIAVLALLLSRDRDFRRRVDARRARQEALARARRNEAMLAELAPAQREHFLGMQMLGGRILDNFARLEGGGATALVRQSRARIDALLQTFLRLSITLNDHRRYLSGTDRDALEAELRGLEADLARGGGGEALREIKERRVAILRKRLERFENAKESREVIAHQLASIEDLLRLLHEQSITLRDPAAITLQLDAIAIELEEAENTVRELDRLLAFDLELRSIGARQAG